MTRQVSDKADPTIEEVRVQSETWRNTRKSRQPIPEQLWQPVVNLFKNYSLYKNTNTLRLDYTKLKKLTRKSFEKSPIETFQSLTSKIMIKE